MSELDALFQFKIGDIVQPKVLGDYASAVSGYHKKERGGSWLAAFTYDEPRVRLVVVERLAQECHGGVQKFYRLRVVGRDGIVNQQLLDLSEFELIAAGPFKKFEGYSKAELQKFVDGLPDK